MTGSGASPSLPSGTGIIVSSPATIPGRILQGTRIETERGAIPVEKLSPGDSLRTLSGALRPILWIGHQTSPIATTSPAVIFEPDALASGCPSGKVAFTPRQTVLVDTLLVPVELLINGATIRPDATGAIAEYFRIELETPDIIFAENLPVEVSCGGNRQIFDNLTDFRALCPDRPPIAPLEHFQPVTEGLMLAALQLRTARRAGDFLRKTQNRKSESAILTEPPPKESSAPSDNPALPPAKSAADHIAELRIFLDRLNQKDAPAIDPPPQRQALILTLPNSETQEKTTNLPAHLTALQDLGFSLSVFPPAITQPENDAPLSVEDKLRSEQNSFDVIYLDGEQVAGFYIALARHYQPQAHIMMAADRLLFPVLDKRATQEKRPELHQQALVMRLRECAIASQTDSILLTEASDGATLKQLVPTARVFSLPQPFRTTTPGRDTGTRTGIILPGAGGTGISAEQARWFVNRIMRRVWAVFPDIPCRILAAGPVTAFAALSGPHVEILPGQDTLDEALNLSRLCVISDIDARSLNAGLLHALALGVPCIMSPAVADRTGVPEGMRARLVAADDNAFVDRLTHLYTNDIARGAASFWGLKHVRDTYGSGRVKQVFAKILDGPTDTP
ncbi:Hint domain-containing protein [Acetobacter conturbans]|nr:Hint domain-containing protein [Acetobacter conturbans]